MRPRFAGRMDGVDAVTAANAGIGTIAVVVATESPTLAARLILVAAILDGVDGLLARRRGPTRLGGLLDSLADVVSFGVAPAALVVAVALPDASPTALLDPYPAIVVTVAALFVVSGVVRLALFTIDDHTTATTRGVPTTLAATVLAAALLADVVAPVVLVAAAAGFVYLMVTDLPYPDLHARDALVMGSVQVLAVAVPTAAGRAFPRALLIAALAYLVFGPWLYWRSSE